MLWYGVILVPNVERYISAKCRELSETSSRANNINSHAQTQQRARKKQQRERNKQLRVRKKQLRVHITTTGGDYALSKVSSAPVLLFCSLGMVFCSLALVDLQFWQVVGGNKRWPSCDWSFPTRKPRKGWTMVLTIESQRRRDLDEDKRRTVYEVSCGKKLRKKHNSYQSVYLGDMLVQVTTTLCF